MKMTAAEAHFLSTTGVYVKPLWQLEHEAKMKELQQRLEYNLNPDNTPTWASPEMGFLMYRERKQQNND